MTYQARFAAAIRCRECRCKEAECGCRVAKGVVAGMSLEYFVRRGDVREARTQTAMALHGLHVTQCEGVPSMFHHVTTSHG